MFAVSEDGAVGEFLVLWYTGIGVVEERVCEHSVFGLTYASYGSDKLSLFGACLVTRLFGSLLFYGRCVATILQKASHSLALCFVVDLGVGVWADHLGWIASI